MQNLGVILAPYGKVPGGFYAEIAQARGGGGTYLPPHDPFFNTRGEVGFHYDTQMGAPKLGLLKRWQLKRRLGLGAIPTDAELSKTYQCYTPVASGWINSKEGFVTGPWRFGWDPAGQYGPPTSLNGLGVEQSQPTSLDVLNAMAMHNRRVFLLTVVSTSAVALSALIAAYRTSRLLRREFKQQKRR